MVLYKTLCECSPSIYHNIWIMGAHLPMTNYQVVLKLQAKIRLITHPIYALLIGVQLKFCKVYHRLILGSDTFAFIFGKSKCNVQFVTEFVPSKTVCILGFKEEQEIVHVILFLNHSSTPQRI